MPEFRLAQHQSEAWRRQPQGRGRRPVCAWLVACGTHYVRVVTVETVSAGDDWAERERHWIAHLRQHYPICANVCDGGEGLAGYVPVRKPDREPVLSTRAIIKSEMARIAVDRAAGIHLRNINRLALDRIRRENVRNRVLNR